MDRLLGFVDVGVLVAAVARLSDVEGRGATLLRLLMDRL